MADVSCSKCKNLEIVNANGVFAKCKKHGKEFLLWENDAREFTCSDFDRKSDPLACIPEKTVIHTVEITSIIKGDAPLRPMEEINRRLAETIREATGCDHVNVVKAQVFEMEKSHEAR